MKHEIRGQKSKNKARDLDAQMFLPGNTIYY